MVLVMPGDITYKFKYDNSKADCPYRIMRAAQDAGEVLSFQETLIDGTKTEFDGQVSVKRTGGGVNGVIEFNLAISLQSDLTVTDLNNKEDNGIWTVWNGRRKRGREKG